MTTRRRTLRLIAGAAGLALAGPAASARSAAPAFRWRGTALGARAEIVIHHPDKGTAMALVAAARAEIDRLEDVFSLYRPDSAVSRLNRDGALDAPPLDLVVLLRRASLWSRRTVGAFDVTVQPLWRLFQAHFADPAADPTGPRRAEVEEVARLVDYRAVDVAAHRITLGAPGMAVTLNGIAQGYIADRVAGLLRAGGLEDVLIDIGEIVAAGNDPYGRPWPVVMPNGQSLRDFGPSEIVDRAVATSQSDGTTFDATGRFHHVFEPRSGRPAAGFRSATVVARHAVDADALSTATLAAGRLPGAPDGFAEWGIERVIAGDPALGLWRIL